MEKRAMAIICRACVVLVALTAIAANANSLLNPGFETGDGTNIANNWTSFNNAHQSGTNTTQFGITVHSGGFSMQTVQPGTTDLDASGAYQDVAASAGQNWRLTGYCLNWQNSELSGPAAFGQPQLQFRDDTGGTGNVLQVFSGPSFGTGAAFPLDTWQFFEVDATNAPAGTTKVRTYVLYVGNNQNNGSVFYDDLNLYQPTGVTTPQSVTTVPAVQVSWPTTARTNGSTIHYQIQSTPTLVFSNVTPVNVLTNAGFEADAATNAANVSTITGWNTGGGGGKATSSYPNPTHSGAGALRLVDTSGGVPVVWQGNAFNIHEIPALPGQVWDLQGYGYVSQTDQPLVGGFGLLKIVWGDQFGSVIQPVAGDTNLIGSPVTGTYAGIESNHVTPGSPQGSWIFMEARATAPVGTAFVQGFCILVGTAPGGAMRFDDLTLAQPVTSFGWKNFGPIFPGTGNTNQVFDPISSSTNKFYRVTTP